jgi:N utilization substance protein B
MDAEHQELEETREDVTPDISAAPLRRRNRMAAVQFLYQWELNRPEELADAVGQFFTAQEGERADWAFGEELVYGVVAHAAEVDAEITARAQNWRFERIAKMDLAILRLAVFELLHRPDIPPIVSINEAIDLSKIFSGPDSKRFVNGILDQLKNTIGRPLRRAAD